MNEFLMHQVGYVIEIEKIFCVFDVARSITWTANNYNWFYRNFFRISELEDVQDSEISLMTILVESAMEFAANDENWRRMKIWQREPNAFKPFSCPWLARELVMKTIRENFLQLT